MPNHSSYSSVRSEEVEELITRIPHSLVRWGTTVIFLLVIAFFIGTWVIRYPDVVSAPFRLTSVNAPKSIVTRSEGRLVRLFVKNGQTVQANQVMGYLESTAHHDEVLQLSNELNRAWQEVNAGRLETLAQHRLTDYRHLGELQPQFQVFEESMTGLQAYLAGHFYSQKKELLLKEIEDLKAMTDNLRQQQLLQQKDSRLAQEEYAVQKKLAEERLIAPLELKREESKLLARTLPYRQTETVILQNETAQRNKQGDLLTLDQQVREYRANFLQRLNTLRSAVEEWKSRYVLTTSIAGRVSFPTLLEENQFIPNRTELFSVIPTGSDYIGLLTIPQQNLGKVKVGQSVLIKFAGYPFEQFGYVKGIITEISEVPLQDGVFPAKVTLPNGLVTTYHQKLRYRTGMVANAEIVTEDLRLLQRFLFQLRKVGEVR
ncbi:HlyD family efflux transporter periplasmic adaptor subunit [Runella zeae]|uniref:HlyD family efflux transporter periplasmic adaptor subunit n=1 Tax=Runella zeae TaxID=94255 RepID=UPI0023548669|nr:HlyD family efflux transporter periplasmic adaptor subunit [Runella zeae]